MKRLLRQGLLTGGIALIITATVVTSWTALGSGRLRSERQEAGAGSSDLAGRPAPGDHHDASPAASGRDPADVDDHGVSRQDHLHSAPASDRATSTAAQPAARSATLSYGPFLLPPAPFGSPAAGQRVGGARIREAHLNLVLKDVKKPCEDCFLTSLRPDLVYPDGRSANLDSGAMLHHAVWFQAGQPDKTCGPETLVGRAGQRFFAAGNERTGAVFVPGFGHYVDDSSWTLIVELMNHTSTPKTVNLTLEVTWLPHSPQVKPLTPIWLDVDNCRDSDYSAPAGPSRTQWRWTSTLTGRIISAAGHLHDGGIKTVLTNLTTGQAVCTSLAGYGRNPAYRGSIESMSTCNWDAIGTVRAGEILAVDAYYELPAPHEDVMGIMLAYVYETVDLSGGTPPPPQTSPEPDPSPRPHEH